MNDENEETHPREYRLYILDRLRQSNGYLFSEIIYDEILALWGHTFGPADMRIIRGRCKWQNEVDWAKAVLNRYRLAKTVKKDGGKYLVLLDPDITDPEWYDLALATPPPKNGFKKRCPKCKAKNKLGAKICKKRSCRFEFPPLNKRIHHKLEE